MRDFLDRELQLQKHFGGRAYILDPAQCHAPENGIAKPQTLPADSDPLKVDPFDGLFKIDVITHLNDKGHLFLYQRVMEKMDWDNICVSTTGVHKLSSQPSEIQVSLCPNPFNLHAKLEFVLPVEGNVEIEIFNILGQNVRTLVNRDFTIGSHQVIWDGTDKFNRIVNSGTYFFRIQIGEHIKIKKGLIIK